MLLVPYYDRTERSPYGYFVIEARSPDNGSILLPDGTKPDTFGFKWGCNQGNFRYRLIDPQSGQVVWERWAEEFEASPSSLRVSDEAWSLIWTNCSCFDQAWAISPKGKKTCSLTVSDGPLDSGLPDDPHDIHIHSKFMGGTTDGLIWEMGSHQYFWNYSGKPYYVVSTGWGDQIVLDLEAGVRVELAGEIRQAFESWERERTTDYLKAAAEDLVDYPSDDSNQWGFTSRWDELTSMIGMAIWLHVKETVPYLRKIHRRSAPIYSSNDLALPKDLDVMRQEYRRLTKLALRLFGEAPEELPCFIVYRGAWKEPELMRYPEGLTDRDERLKSIRFGMSLEQVLQTVGVPDFVPYSYYPMEEDASAVPGLRSEYYYGLGKETSALQMTWYWDEKTDEFKMVLLRHIAPLTQENIEYRVTMNLTGL